MQIREQKLIMPIIGVIDSQRAQQLTQDLLRAVRTSRARVVVMDITGVPSVDSKVANHLVQTVEAPRLRRTIASREMSSMMLALGRSAEGRNHPSGRCALGTSYELRRTRCSAGSTRERTDRERV